MRNGLLVAPLFLCLSVGSAAHAASLEPGSVYLKVTRPRLRKGVDAWREFRFPGNHTRMTETGRRN